MADPAGPVPKEAVDFLRSKKLKVGFDYRDVWREEHASKFTVAGVNVLDVLGDVRDSLGDAVERGQPFAEWRKQLKPTLVKKGWWGPNEVVDEDTGETKVVDLSQPYRLKTIYDTNMRQAYSAGQWQRIRRTKRALPYLLYEVGPSVHHRPEHLAWNGTLLPVDDPWWDTHPTPGGWGCKCHKRQVSRAEHDDMVANGVRSPGVQVIDPDTGLPTGHIVTQRIEAQTTAPATEWRKWKNARTGQTELVPKGIDPGFDTNPGQQYRVAKQMQVLAEKLAVAEEGVAQAVVQSWAVGPALDQWFAKPVQAVPVAVVTDAQAAEVKARTRVVMLSADTVEKQRKAHPELSVNEYKLVAQAVAKGRAIKDGPRSLVYVFTDAKGYVTVVQSTQSGLGLFLKSFRRLSSDQAKRDAEVRRLLAKADEQK
jgi:uncharacterized protein with gpF-like domain